MTAALIAVIIFFTIPPFTWQVFAVVVSAGALQILSMNRAMQQAQFLGIPPPDVTRSLVAFLLVAAFMILILGVCHGIRHLVRKKRE